MITGNNTFDIESACKASVIAKIEITKQSVQAGCEIASGVRPRNDG